MVSRIAVVAFAAAAAGGASASLADSLDPARLYAAGQRAEALAAIASRSDFDRVAELKALVALSRDGTPSAGALSRAALMLHTDRILVDRAEAPAVEAAERCGSADDDRLARSIASIVVARPDSRAFARRWFVALARRSLWDVCLPFAQFIVNDGLKWFPGDAELLLVRGTAHETAGSVGLTVNTARLDGPRFVDLPEGRFREKLTRAAEALQQALAVEPEMHEARLRLGRVLWRLGDARGAQAALEQVIASARAPELLSLAHTFLARVHDDAGRPEEAERSYRRVLAIDPTAQASAVGLAQLLARGGDGDGARLVLETAVAATPRPAPRDAYMSYHVGLRSEPDALVDALRAEVGP
ncbi:MAG: tetratricopeptide repeat protein [Vicinamibacteria bacterium]